VALIRSSEELGGLPAGEASRIWKMILHLASDPNPSAAYEARFGGTNMDPAMMAINTTRPQAIDAAMRFAYWCAQCPPGQGRERMGVLAAHTEVADLLKAHLDPTIDPSLSVRAAIGQWLTSLARTDADWVTQNAHLLLPNDVAHEERRDALWRAFVRWAPPHQDALGVLEPFYRAAIQRIGSERDSRDAEEADNHLAEHLVTLYWWGAIALRSPNNLLEHFFARADARRRIHAMKHIGYSLYHTPKPAHEVPVDLLMRLWEWRAPLLIDVATSRVGIEQEEAAGAAREELQQFGWWFAAGACEPVWSLTELAKVIQVSGTVELDHAVTEQLASYAALYPQLAVRCLLAVDFSGGSEPWSIHSWVQHFPAIVGAAFRSDDDTAKQLAREAVNRAVASGHVELRGLLAEENGG
jgi:hypothetical protein